MMKELLNVNGRMHFNDRKPAYDGRKGFYTAGALPFTSKDFVVKLIDKDETGAIRYFFLLNWHTFYLDYVRL